jgi:hypothetical protein
MISPSGKNVRKAPGSALFLFPAHSDERATRFSSIAYTYLNLAHPQPKQNQSLPHSLQNTRAVYPKLPILELRRSRRFTCEDLNKRGVVPKRTLPTFSASPLQAFLGPLRQPS